MDIGNPIDIETGYKAPELLPFDMPIQAPTKRVDQQYGSPQGQAPSAAAQKQSGGRDTKTYLIIGMIISLIVVLIFIVVFFVRKRGKKKQNDDDELPNMEAGLREAMMGAPSGMMPNPGALPNMGIAPGFAQMPAMQTPPIGAAQGNVGVPRNRSAQVPGVSPQVSLPVQPAMTRPATQPAQIAPPQIGMGENNTTSAGAAIIASDVNSSKTGAESSAQKAAPIPGASAPSGKLEVDEAHYSKFISSLEDEAEAKGE